jgi:hypothetical protein
MCFYEYTLKYLGTYVHTPYIHRTYTIQCHSFIFITITTILPVGASSNSRAQSTELYPFFQQLHALFTTAPADQRPVPAPLPRTSGPRHRRPALATVVIPL